PADSVAVEALAAMRSCFNVDSTVMTRRLVEVRKHYYIPSEYELHVPLPGERPYNAFLSGFNLLIDALEAGLRFPLHSVIELCLEGWQISPSQMAPNSWLYECSSGKLMNRVGKLAVWGLHFVSALIDQAERPKAVAAYKASLGFESGLEKMGRFIYKFGYRVALERLRGKHPEIAIEQDPFVECPYDVNVEIDLN
ncbi:hypothetical protein GW17_00055269, partial [Ensete ventricosum]